MQGGDVSRPKMNDPELTGTLPISTVDQTLPARRDDTPTIMELMREALQKGPDGTAALKDLVDLHHKISDRQAAQEFADALADFQAHCPKVVKSKLVDYVTKTGTRVKFQYAPLDEVVPLLRPELHKRGLSFTWDTDISDNRCTASFILRHTNGHSVVSRAAAPIDSGSKMSLAQQWEAARSYAKRASLVQGLGIVAEDDNPDAPPPGGFDRITDKQAADLEAKIQEVGADRARFLKLYGVTSVDDLPQFQYDAAIAVLVEKGRQPKGAKS